jgi:enamine deaminase RidA (YjgF/YER057c/UK114 family)
MAHISQVQYYNEPVEKQMGFVALVQTGKTLHLAGIVSVDDALNVVAPNDMAGQIERIYDIMEKTLANCGATLQHVVNELVFVTDLHKFGPAASAARAKRYAKCAPPATTAVQVSALFFPAAMIEIQATAVLP